METSFGFGQLMGPIIGSALYSIGGYQCPFYLFAFIFFLAILLFQFYLPNDQKLMHSLGIMKDQHCIIEISQKTDMNQQDISVNDIIQDNLVQAVPDKKSLSVKKFLKDRDYFLTYLVPIFGFQALGFIMATISEMLSNKYGLSSSINGLVFSIATLSYFLTMPLYNKVGKKIERKVWMSMGLLFSSLSVLLVAPQEQMVQWLHIPHQYQLILTCLGLCLLGIGSAFIYIPILPQLIIYAQKIYSKPSEQEKVNDMSVGFMNSGVNFSLFFSPIFGGI